MSLLLVYHHKVPDDVDTAYEWYEQQRMGLGNEFLAAVRLQLDLIQDNPELCAVLSRNVRASTVHQFPYVIYYRIEAERIYVLAVQHSSRHPRVWQSRN